MEDVKDNQTAAVRMIIKRERPPVIPRVDPLII